MSSTRIIQPLRLFGAALVLATLFAALPNQNARAATSAWQLISAEPTFMAGAPGAMALLTNGKILVQDQGPANSGSSNWWLYSPTATGSYVNGTWSPAGDLPSGYGPEYFGLGVLPDGRVIIEGGEFNGTPTQVAENLGALYDPTSNSWTAVSPPAGGTGCWSTIADAPSVVLANGVFMMGASGTRTANCQALFNSSTQSWNTTGSGKADPNAEEGFTLLPSGKVLDVNTANVPSGLGGTSNSEIYDPATGSWTTAGNTPMQLDNSIGEIGPAALMPNGTVFAEGATSATALYNSASGTWSAGPNLPIVGGQQMNADDACSAVLPDGSVLFDASPNQFAPTHWFTFDGTNISQVPDDLALNASQEQSNYCNAIVLPTGQVLITDRGGRNPLEIYTSSGSAQASYQPTVQDVPATIVAGMPYTIHGTQFGGLDQGAYFGDDFNGQTNYPLLRITNVKTGHVTYARTSNSTGLSVAASTPGSTTFVVPATATDGPSKAEVVVNGIASTSTTITVSGGLAAPSTPSPPPPNKKHLTSLKCVKRSSTRFVHAVHPRCPPGWHASRIS